MQLETSMMQLLCDSNRGPLSDSGDHGRASDKVTSRIEQDHASQSEDRADDRWKHRHLTAVDQILPRLTLHGWD